VTTKLYIQRDDPTKTLHLSRVVSSLTEFAKKPGMKLQKGDVFRVYKGLVNIAQHRTYTCYEWDGSKLVKAKAQPLLI